MIKVTNVDRFLKLETSQVGDLKHPLSVAPSQDASGKWRFLGIPDPKTCNEGGHCYWEGVPLQKRQI